MRFCAFICMGLTFLASCDYYVVNPHREIVGQLSESGIGNPDFEPCFKENIFPYYYSRTPAGFSPGKDSLRTYYLSQYDNKGIVSESGYLTFRFVINCKGDKGWYEIKQLGLDFNEKKFNSILVDQLLALTEDLGSWAPIRFGDTEFDSFIHLTFKISNGELVEILP